MSTASRTAAALAAAFVALLPGALLAQPSSAAANEAGAPLLRLQADASREVSDDVAVAVFRVEQEGAQPGPLQSAVNRVLESALADLRRDAALIVRSGQYGTYPRHARDGRIEGWRVRAELIAESSDVTAISRATATLSARMQVASVGFRLSQAARERTESELTSEAAKNFRDKARAAAIALGYAGADLVEANYTTDSPSLPTPLAQMRSAVAASAESVAVPLEPGRSRVTVGFSGAFRLTR